MSRFARNVFEVKEYKASFKTQRNQSKKVGWLCEAMTWVNLPKSWLISEKPRSLFEFPLGRVRLSNSCLLPFSLLFVCCYFWHLLLLISQHASVLSPSLAKKTLRSLDEDSPKEGMRLQNLGDVLIVCLPAKREFRFFPLSSATLSELQQSARETESMKWQISSPWGQQVKAKKIEREMLETKVVVRWNPSHEKRQAGEIFNKIVLFNLSFIHVLFFVFEMEVKL